MLHLATWPHRVSYAARQALTFLGAPVALSRMGQFAGLVPALYSAAPR